MPSSLAWLKLEDLGSAELYDPVVPTPAKVLGYPLGSRISTHSDIMRYLARLADHGCLELTSLGRSFEGRALAQATVTSRANLDRLDSLRALSQRLADPDAPPPDLSGQPVVVRVMAAVHGDEFSGAEATLALAYVLAAGRGQRADVLRQQAVVLIDPIQNPDGRERAATAFYSLHGLRTNPDRHSAEHVVPWPGGRGSHYAFDLNRDWCLLTHPETRALAAAHLAWRPQVVIDLHEQDTPGYYFPPPAPPLEPNLPAGLSTWWERLGRAVAAAFEARGWDYFVGERYDSFYPGYGESWPLYHGAIGSTYEQESARTLAYRTKRGVELSLAAGTERHLVAAYATVAAAVDHRLELLGSFRAEREGQVRAGLESPRQALIIEAGPRAADAAELAASLRAQGAWAEQAVEPLELTAEPHDGGQLQPVSVAAGSVVLPLAQPARALLLALCDSQTPMPEGYLEAESSRLDAALDPSIYDVTAWSLPHRWGLKAWWTESVPDVEFGPSGHELGRGGAGYLMPLETRASYQALAAMAREPGWRPRIATRHFEFDGQSYPRGTVILLRGEQELDLTAGLAAISARTGCRLDSVEALWDGRAGSIALGTSHAVAWRAPRLAMLTREPVQPEAAGWLAYLLEQVYDLPYTPLSVADLTAEMLREYDVLLVPDSSRYAQALGSTAEVLQGFVVAGGVVVALGAAASAYASSIEAWRGATPITDLGATGATTPEGKAVPPAGRPQHMPGSSAWVEVSAHSYLTYGCPERMLVPLWGSTLFEPANEGRLAGRLTGEPGYGWLPERMAAAIADKAWLWDRDVEAGRVVCFGTAPTFRASWPMLDRLWLNAAFFSRDNGWD